ncbi:MAG TPA: hypothetical protein VG676_13920 [Chitinophagaceae bacterium]|jgi:thiol-disulfide isomerase/thioredoxin|nr:hypothetical protein [Chitinophagaceae bacterium]
MNKPLLLSIMKKQLFLLLATICTLTASAQTDSTRLPAYKRFPSLPPVKLLLTDSVRYFTKDNFSKKEPVLIILFNPDCEHCQKETEELLDSMDHFKNVQIVMATMMPFDKMIAFYKRYKLANYNNIVVAQDTQYFLPVFYMVSNLPYLALYNKKGELITTFEGAVPIHRVFEEFNE